MDVKGANFVAEFKISFNLCTICHCLCEHLCMWSFYFNHSGEIYVYFICPNVNPWERKAKAL